MRVESKPTMVYVFTQEEREYLIRLDIWTYIYGRLKDNERIEIE